MFAANIFGEHDFFNDKKVLVLEHVEGALSDELRDEALREELVASEKDSAELAMILSKLPFAGFVEGSDKAQILPELTPHDGDVVVTHQRVGGFSASQLDTLLRSRGIAAAQLDPGGDDQRRDALWSELQRVTEDSERLHLVLAEVAVGWRPVAERPDRTG